MTRLSLRLRIFLFFALIAVVGVLGYGGGMYLAYARAGIPEMLWPMVQAATIGCFALLSALVGVWLLFDENVARPLIALANDLRSRAHSEVSSDVEAQSARYLGDIAPAAQAVTANLRESRDAAEQVAQERSERLSRECRRLAAILRDAPVGMILCNREHRIVLYNTLAARQCGGPEGALRLRCALGDILPDAPIREALAALDAGEAEATLSAKTATGCAVDLAISPIHADDDDVPDGYMLILRSAGRLPVRDRSACYDLDLLTTPAVVERERARLPALDYVVFDTETTGLHPDQGDEIVQIAGLRIVNGKPVGAEVFDMLVDPGRTIPARSTAIHGITDDRVRGAPTVASALQRFHAFSREAVLVAHNAPFDLAFLRKGEGAAGLRFEGPVLDTVLLSAIVFGAGEDHSLDALAKRLDIDIPEAARHTAMGDSIATREAFLKLLPLLETHGIETLAEALAAEDAMRPKLKMPPIA